MRSPQDPEARRGAEPEAREKRDGAAQGASPRAGGRHQSTGRVGVAGQPGRPVEPLHGGGGAPAFRSAAALHGGAAAHGCAAGQARAAGDATRVQHRADAHRASQHPGGDQRGDDAADGPEPVAEHPPAQCGRAGDRSAPQHRGADQRQRRGLPREAALPTVRGPGARTLARTHPHAHVAHAPSRTHACAHTASTNPRTHALMPALMPRPHTSDVLPSRDAFGPPAPRTPIPARRATSARPPWWSEATNTTSRRGCACGSSDNPDAPVGALGSRRSRRKAGSLWVRAGRRGLPAGAGCSSSRCGPTRSSYRRRSRRSGRRPSRCALPPSSERRGAA